MWKSENLDDGDVDTIVGLGTVLEYKSFSHRQSGLL
jgi:hypothetical protein